jgi:hypothetical protein
VRGQPNMPIAPSIVYGFSEVPLSKNNKLTCNGKALFEPILVSNLVSYRRRDFQYRKSKNSSLGQPASSCWSFQSRHFPSRHTPEQTPVMKIMASFKVMQQFTKDIFIALFLVEISGILFELTYNV